jgi:hypothetical protein
MPEFIVTYSAFSEASADDVWKTLTDLTTWTAWDTKLENVVTLGAKKAAAGVTYTLKPEAGNEVTVKITKADDYVFEDEAKLVFGTIQTRRSVHPLKEEGCIVTQTLRANVDEKDADDYAEVFWADWSQGLIDCTKALARYPFVVEFLSRHKNA